MNYIYYVKTTEGWHRVPYFVYYRSSAPKIKSISAKTSEELDAIWAESLGYSKKTVLRDYYATGKVLLNNHWESCGCLIVAETMSEAAKKAEKIENFKLHSIKEGILSC